MKTSASNLFGDFSFSSDCISEKGNSIFAGDRCTESQVDFSADLLMGSFEMPSGPNDSSLLENRNDDEFFLMSDRLLFEPLAASQSFMPISPSA